MVVAPTTQLLDTESPALVPGRVEAHGVTDVGLRRQNNEDAFGFDEELGVFVVCDGLGGHAAGEVASSLAVQVILDEFAKRHAVTPMTANDPLGAPYVVQQSALRSSLRRAHTAITESQNEDAEREGMGTTMAALKLMADGVLLAHVGDSRVYRWSPDAGLARVTRDHSLYNRLVDDGVLAAGTTEQGFSKRNVIMRALGLRDHRADIRAIDRRAGDVFVLCSDGVSDMLDDTQIAEIVAFFAGDPEPTAHGLIQAANSEGGRDNITAVVVRLEAAGSEARAAGDDAMCPAEMSGLAGPEWDLGGKATPAAAPRVPASGLCW